VEELGVPRGRFLMADFVTAILLPPRFDLLFGQARSPGFEFPERLFRSAPTELLHT